jgi:hypothetical protein
MDLIELGINAFRAGQKEQTISYFTEAVRQFPNSVTAWFWLGKTLNDPSKKKACFDRVLQIDPDFRSKVQSGRVGNSDSRPANPAPPRNADTASSPKPGPQKKILLFGSLGALLLIACLSMGLFTMDRIQHPHMNQGNLTTQNILTPQLWTLQYIRWFSPKLLSQPLRTCRLIRPPHNQTPFKMEKVILMEMRLRDFQVTQY